MKSPDFPPPAPDAGWALHSLALDAAQIAPADTSRLRQRAGVVTAEGGYCWEGALWRYGRPLTLPPEPAEPAAVLAGTWLWGGVLFDHFGHFLIESTSRLWGAHEGQHGPIAGVCFIPKRPRRKGGLRGWQQGFLDLFGIAAPARILTARTRVERLIVPGQGLGLGGLIGGSGPMRAAVHRHFAADIAAEGPERLYISRSALTDDVGIIIGETQIEAELAAAGYEIFHPQEHDLRTQIARYKAARQIIFADGSAGHLLAYVARADQQIACLPRRSFWWDGPVDQIAGFAGRAPLVADTIASEWQPPEGSEAPRGTSYVAHDLPRLGALLRAEGFLPPGPDWAPLATETLAAALAPLAGWPETHPALIRDMAQ